MSRVAYVDGRFVPQRDAAVRVEDRGLQFADGVYEVVYVAAGRFVDAERHFARLERSLGEIRIPMPMAPAALRPVLQEVARRNRVRDGLVYMQVTRGAARRDHAFPRPAVRPTLIVTARRMAAYPRDVERWAVTAITRPDERWARCDIKSTGLLANVLAKEAARQAGAAEAILVDGQGMVTEGASANVWIVDGAGRLRTRQLDPAILPGCTRGALIALIEAAGIGFDEGAFSAETLASAREVFLTSATSFVKPVVAVDGKPVANGGVGLTTRRLFDLFAQHVGAGLP